MYRSNLLGSLFPSSDDSEKTFQKYINFEPSNVDQRILSLKSEAISLLESEAKMLTERLRELKEGLTLKEVHADELADTPVQKLIKKNYQEPPMVYQNRDFLLCGRSTMKLLILVFTEYEQKREREIIRKTWGNFKMFSEEKNYELRWKRVFVIGRPFQAMAFDIGHSNEVIFGRDLLNVHSDRTNTMGTMYGALHWAANGCSFENLLIIRPNMFVNIPAMYHFLHTKTKPRKNFYLKASLTQNNVSRVAQNSLKNTGNLAWMISNDLVFKLLRLSKMYTASNTALSDDVFLNYMKVFKAQKYEVDNFMTRTTDCHFEEEFALNGMSSMDCLRMTYDEYKFLSKRKEVDGNNRTEKPIETDD